MNDKRQKIVIAGATGFIGKNLIQYLLDHTEFELVGLSRFEVASTNPRLSFKVCDLFSLLEVEKALIGIDAAIYLVHSMLPSANLDQGHFYDYDLLLADNFARACKKNEIKQVVYLGGLIPKNDTLSWHLKSRLEVENVFAHNGLNLTALRAGLIVGPGGSSFQIMETLVRRLPILVCPRWTKNKMTPVDLRDIVVTISLCLLNPKYYSKIYDVAGPKSYTYHEMMRVLSLRLGLKRIFLPVPVNFVGFSKLWVRLITGAKKELVYPLLDSLKHAMVGDPSQAFPDHPNLITYEDGLKADLAPKAIVPKKFFVKRKRPFVRSVQRLPLPASMHAQDVAREYMKWLPRFLFPIFFVTVSGDEVVFSIIHPKIKMLVLYYSSDRSSDDRSLFYVRGGLLARPSQKGRLEFRETLDRQYIITAIHDFEPSLPWSIYRLTQALVHLWVMYSFGRHLMQLKEKNL
jgi:uncharacterized protein YbjT (DUF2867 family)